MSVRKFKPVRLGAAKTLTLAAMTAGLPEMAGIFRERVGG
jgi:hypothetical protein